MPHDVVMFSGVNHGAELYNCRPGGMHRIATHLRQQGISVKTINYFSQMTSDQFDRAVEIYVTEDTKMIGISATVLSDQTNNYFFGVNDSEFRRRIALIKNKNPSIKVVLGGGQVTDVAVRMLKKFSKEIDYVSRGQGENVALAIYRHITSGAPLVTTAISPVKVVTDSTYSFDDFNLCRMVWHQDDNVYDKECLPIEIARGCIFKCKFCSYQLIGKKFNDWTKTEQTIRAELLENFENYGTQHYQFLDDLINDSPEKIDLLHRIIASLPFKIYFSGYLRLDLLWKYPDMIQKLKDMGLVSCFFGIETINDASGKVVGKGLGRHRIEQALEWCHDVWQGDVHIEAYVILGLPKDTIDTGPESFAWAQDLHNRGWLHQIYFKPLVIRPDINGSEIDRDPEKFGYVMSNNHAVESDTTQKRYLGIDPAWTLGNYTYYQAVEQASQYNNYFFSRYQVPSANTFNVPHLLSLMQDSLSETDMLRIITGKKQLSPNLKQALEGKLQIQARRKTNQYFQILFNH